MKTYYRFRTSTLEFLDYDTKRVTLNAARVLANKWARDCGATLEYCGIFVY